MDEGLLHSACEGLVREGECAFTAMAACPKYREGSRYAVGMAHSWRCCGHKPVQMRLGRASPAHFQSTIGELEMVRAVY